MARRCAPMAIWAAARGSPARRGSCRAACRRARGQRDELLGRAAGRAAHAPAARSSRRARADRNQVLAHGVEHPRSMLHQARQDFVDVRRSEMRRPRRSVRTAPSVPARAPSQDFAQRLALAHEQKIFAPAAVPAPAPPPPPAREIRSDSRNGCPGGRRIRCRRCDDAPARRQDRDSVLADHAHELPPAARELLAVHGFCSVAQCSRWGDGYAWLRSGSNSSNTTWAATRMNSTSSA